MDGFSLALRGWGLHVAVRRPLTDAEHEDFADLCQRACWMLRGRGAGWGAVVDLSGMPVGASMHERLIAPMHLARQHGAGRVAVLVSGRRSADVLSEALRDAGLGERSRVFVAPGGEAQGLRQAQDWLAVAVAPCAGTRAA